MGHQHASLQQLTGSRKSFSFDLQAALAAKGLQWLESFTLSVTMRKRFQFTTRNVTPPVVIRGSLTKPDPIVNVRCAVESPRANNSSHNHVHGSNSNVRLPRRNLHTTRNNHPNHNKRFNVLFLFRRDGVRDSNRSQRGPRQSLKP